MDPTTFLLIEIWLLTAVSAVYGFRVWRKTGRFVNLSLIAIGAMFYFYLLPGVLQTLLPGFDGMRLCRDFSESTQLTMTLLLPLAYGGFFLGLNVRISSRSQRDHERWPNLQIMQSEIRSGLLALLSTFFLLVGAYGVVQQLLHAGGLLAVIAGGSGSYMQARLETGGMSGPMAALLPIGVLGWVIAIYSSRRVVPMFKLVASILILAFGMLLFALLTVRHNTAMIVFGLLAFIESRSLRIARWAVPTLLVGFVVLAMVLVSIRAMPNREPGFDVGMMEREYEQLVQTEHIIDHVNESGYLYGKHFWDLPEFLIPRVLWDEKPETATLNREFWPEMAMVGAEKEAGLIGEGYSEFGFPTVFLSAVVFGVLVRRLEDRLRSTHTNQLQNVLFAAAISGLVYSWVRTGLVGKHLITPLCMLAQTAILNYACVYRPQARRSSSGFAFETRQPDKLLVGLPLR